MIEVAGWILFIGLVWYLPGMVIARLLADRAGLRDHPAAYLAVCWIASPVLFSALAVVMGLIHVSPLVIVALVCPVAVVGAWKSATWASWRGVVLRAPAVLLIPILVGAIVTALPPEESLTADTNAHIAAVRRSVEESSVFPVRGFHGDEATRGPDPRFGTLHAFYGVAVRISGTEPAETWHVMRGLGLVLLLSGALALLSVVVRSRLAIGVGVLCLVATLGGVYYSVPAVAAYPLWFALGITWTLLAVILGRGFGHPTSIGVAGGIVLAGLAGIHFFAYMLAGFLLAALSFVAGKDDRRAALLALVVATVISVPHVAIRLATSYVNANPIHQKIWQCMEWAPGLYSASPVFVAGWLFPYAFVILVWGAVRWRDLSGSIAYRWLMCSAVAALMWISVPWLLTPSMALIGFLPLRLLMAVGAPFLLSILIDRQVTRRRVIALATSLLLVPALWSRVERLVPAGMNAGGEHWAELAEKLMADGESRPVVLSDPFSMLALSAAAAVDVVAVPDGRSSPRDALAIERLRDSWRAMSPVITGARTDAILGRHGVTHVVLNVGLPDGLTSYEYPVDAGSFGSQLAKFTGNPHRFVEVWRAGDLVLFGISDGAGAEWNEDYLSSCRSDRVTEDPGVSIGSGYHLAGASAGIVGSGDSRMLRIDGLVTWSGEAAAPDRQLVVRLDRVPSRVPPALVGVGKPVRKLREFFGAPRARFRWDVSPASGGCPIWLAAGTGPIELNLELHIPEGIPGGKYAVTLVARDQSVFEPIRPRDLFVDADLYQGPLVSTIRIP